MFGRGHTPGREARGTEAVNSVWFWGEGDGGRPAADFDLVLADHPLALALATAAGIPTAPLPRQLQPARLAGRRVLVVHDGLLAPALDGQVELWRAELGRLESEWFAPLRAALRIGKLGRLQLERLGDPASRHSLTLLSGWQAWRRAGSLCT